MRVNGVKLPYPDQLKSELEEYKERMLKEDEIEGQKPTKDFYKQKPIEQKIIQVKRHESISPVLKKLMVNESSVSMQPLKTIGSNVFGNLFDRKKFLAARIKETESFIEERRHIHEKFNKDIESDIAEMERIISTIADREELREFKINLNLLKMEKRKENDVFWRDMVNLRNQCRELKEEFEMESKIADLFSDLDAV